MISAMSLALSGTASVLSRILENHSAQKVLFNALRLNREEAKRSSSMMT